MHHSFHRPAGQRPLPGDRHNRQHYQRRRAAEAAVAVPTAAQIRRVTDALLDVSAPALIDQYQANGWRCSVHQSPHFVDEVSAHCWRGREEHSATFPTIEKASAWLAEVAI